MKPIASLCFLVTFAFSQPIDRFAVVSRHNVTITTFDTLASLTVGNGTFAVTVDPTGLQTFPEYYENGICLGTFSDWGWHTLPNVHNYSFQETFKYYTVENRSVPYSVQWDAPKRKKDATTYFRANPHRIHLGVLGFDFLTHRGTRGTLADFSKITQELLLWKGVIESSYTFDGVPVSVRTCVHPSYDALACRVLSPLVSTKQLRLRIRFPYPSLEHTSSGCVWENDSLHSSQLVEHTEYSALFLHTIDSVTYFLTITWDKPATIAHPSPHEYLVLPRTTETTFSIVAHFHRKKEEGNFSLSFTNTFEQCIRTWESFWQSGGAVDFSQCTDPRAFELERRIVLSQYLTRVQCAGILPPQETGLTYTSWYGKFHLEMLWWHAVHYILWNRREYAERMLQYFFDHQDIARETAQRQGYSGVRWQKMTSPTGMDSPSNVGSFLVWQQPHIISIAELLYQQTHDSIFLQTYAPLVFETAEFMASYARYDSTQKRYIIGPPLIPAQECFLADSTFNPPFELAYWRYGLRIAQEWRKRLGLPPHTQWDSVVSLLATPPISDRLYLFAENRFDSYTPRFMHDHPIVLGMFGMLPNTGIVDTSIMKRTFLKILTEWDWEQTWGWDFPLAAMTATRLHLPDSALDLLFQKSTKNTYLRNGHNFQDARLRIYLPGNGALLTAIAMMCAGYQGCQNETPGFPKNGSWNVRWEGLLQLP